MVMGRIQKRLFDRRWLRIYEPCRRPVSSLSLIREEDAWRKVAEKNKTDVKTLVQIIKSKLKREKIQDDKTMIMERTIQIVAKLPHNSRLREQLTNTFIEELWDSLDHPPMLYMGDEFKYRRADGSYNVRLTRSPFQSVSSTF